MAAPKFNALVASKIKAYKLPDDKDLVNMVDGSGLDLQWKRVKRAGGSGEKQLTTATWRFTYARPKSAGPKAGKRNTIVIGTFAPHTTRTLEEARKEVERLRKLIEHNIDPSNEKQEAKAALERQMDNLDRINRGEAVIGSFKEAMQAYHKHRTTPGLVDTWSDGTAGRWMGAMELHVLPRIGDMHVKEITGEDVYQCVKALEVVAKIETANHVRESIGQVLRYAIAMGQLDRNVANDIEPRCMRHAGKKFPRLKDPKVMGQLYKDLGELATKPSGHSGNLVVSCTMVQVQMLLWQRPGMIQRMEWTELDYDHPVGPRWTVPAAKMKLNAKQKNEDSYDHVVPLPQAAIDLIEKMRIINGHKKHVFSTQVGTDLPPTSHTMNSPLRKLGFPREELVCHGFRGMGQTMSGDRLTSWKPNGSSKREVTEMHLAHVPPGLGRVYNEAEYVEERAKLMDHWAAFVRQQAFGAEVVELKQAA